MYVYLADCDNSIGKCLYFCSIQSLKLSKLLYCSICGTLIQSNTISTLDTLCHATINARKLFEHKFISLSIAFTQLSELGGHRVNVSCPTRQHMIRFEPNAVDTARLRFTPVCSYLATVIATSQSCGARVL